MSTVDPSIPLSGRGGFDVPQYLEVASMAQKLRQNQINQQKQNALSQILSNPGSYDQSGSINQNALRTVTGINPELGIAFKSQDIQEKLRLSQEKHYESENGKAQFDFMSGIAGTGYDAYTEAKKAGKPEADAVAAGKAAVNSAVDASGGMLSDQQIQGVKSHPFDPVQVKAFASMNKDWIAGNRAQSVAELGVKKEEVAEKNADTSAKREGAFERNIESEARHRNNQDDLAQEKLSRAKEQEKAGLMTDDAIDMAARRVVNGESAKDVLANFGRGKQGSQNLAAVQNKFAQLAKDEGLSPQDIATKQAEMKGFFRSELELGAREGKIAPRVQEAHKFAEIALTASDKVPRGNWTDYTKVSQWGAKHVSDPDLRAFQAANTSLQNAYAAAVGGGVMHVEDQKRAAEMLSTSDGPDAYKAVVKQMLTETDAALQAPEDVKDIWRKRGTPAKGDEKSALPDGDKPAAGKTPPLKNAKGWVLHKDAKGNMAYVGPNQEVEAVR